MATCNIVNYHNSQNTYVAGRIFGSSVPDFDPPVAVLFLVLDASLMTTAGFSSSFLSSEILAAATRAEALVGLELEFRESAESSVSSHFDFWDL